MCYVPESIRHYKPVYSIKDLLGYIVLSMHKMKQSLEFINVPQIMYFLGLMTEQLGMSGMKAEKDLSHSKSRTSLSV